MNNMLPKSRLITLLSAAAIICSGISGCNQQDAAPETIGTATVSISIDRNFSVDSTSATVRFTPSDNATGFRYAIGTVSDLESFRDGTLGTSVYVEGNGSVEQTFTDLDPISMYSVYAVAIDENGLEGSISSSKIITDDNDFSVSSSFLLSRSAAFRINVSPNYSSVNYYLGQDGDLDAFLSGDIEASSLSNFEEMTVNYFDLEPDSDYVFFIQFIDRYGISAKLIEYPFHTSAAGECPGTDFSYDNDVYTGTYTLSAENGSTRIAAIINTQGTFDGLINNPLNWKGDIVNMIDSWKDIEAGQVYLSNGTEELDIEFSTPSLDCGTEIELYVLLYGEDGQPCGVERYRCTTPQYDEDAPAAKAEVTVRDITSTGATYDYTIDGQTLACMYDTVDADWFDELKETDEYSEYYLHNLLFSQGYYFHYNDGTSSGSNWSFTETTGQPGHRYYAVACPMNCNGPRGWGEMVMVEFTTLSE